MTTIESAEFAESPESASSFSEVYSDALRGEACTVRGISTGDQPLPVHEWLRPVSHADRVLLAHCRGATLDVGCGPGRMSAHLAERGHVVLGVDIVREAVDQARRRGVSALRRNVFDPLPGEGRWDTVLLADGNIGIGGAPVRLLRRAADLARAHRTDRLRPGRPGDRCPAPRRTAGHRPQTVRLVPVGRGRGRGDRAGRGATPACTSTHLGDHHGRWFAVLSR